MTTFENRKNLNVVEPIGDINVRIKDTNGKEIAADDLGYLVVLDIGHHKVHEEKHFYKKTVMDVTGSGTVVYFMFITPALPTRIHARAQFSVEDEFLVEIYNDATVSDNGVELGMINNDHNSSVTSSLVCYSGPTVTDDGVEKWKGRIGAARESGISPGVNYEIVAKPESNYLFKITKANAGTHYVDCNFWYYEA